MISIILLAALELVKAQDLIGLDWRLMKYGPDQALAIRHMTEVGGNWYSVAWDYDKPIAVWNRDTIEVCLRDSSKVRALEQYAATATDELDPVALAGVVSTSDLFRRPLGGREPIQLWVRLPHPIDPKLVVGLRVRPPEVPPRANVGR